MMIHCYRFLFHSGILALVRDLGLGGLVTLVIYLVDYQYLIHPQYKNSEDVYLFHLLHN